MASFLLTEISLNFLGNKFYTLDGEHVDNLLSLCKLPEINIPSDEPSLQKVLCISETVFREVDNLNSEVIVMNVPDGEEQNMTEVKTPLARKILESPQRRIRLNKDTALPASVELVQTDYIPNLKAEEKRFKLKINCNIRSENAHQRLMSIIKACFKEYKEMKDESNAAKEHYQRLGSNSRSRSDKKNIQIYYRAQKKVLIKEKRLLLDFMKFMKGNASDPKSVLLSRMESDLHRASKIMFA